MHCMHAMLFVSRCQQRPMPIALLIPFGMDTPLSGQLHRSAFSRAHDPYSSYIGLTVCSWTWSTATLLHCCYLLLLGAIAPCNMCRYCSKTALRKYCR